MSSPSNTGGNVSGNTTNNKAPANCLGNPSNSKVDNIDFNRLYAAALGGNNNAGRTPANQAALMNCWKADVVNRTCFPNMK